MIDDPLGVLPVGKDIATARAGLAGADHHIQHRLRQDGHGATVAEPVNRREAGPRVPVELRSKPLLPLLHLRVVGWIHFDLVLDARLRDSILDSIAELVVVDQ